MWFKSFRSRVLKELLLAPSVILPIVAGASAWLISWASGGVSALNIAGLIGVLGGVGWLGTRFIFMLESIVQKVHTEDQAKILKAQEQRLAAVLKRMRYDRDPRTDDYFMLLRKARDDFNELAEKPNMIVRGLDLRAHVNTLFWAAIEQLDRSYYAFELSEQLLGEERKNVVAKREEILADVKKSVEQLQDAVEQFQKASDKENSTDLSSLRDELDESLRIAARTEERMRELEGKKDYSEYLRE
jgi:hypothetical protein